MKGKYWVVGVLALIVIGYAFMNSEELRSGAGLEYSTFSKTVYYKDTVTNPIVSPGINEGERLGTLKAYSFWIPYSAYTTATSYATTLSGGVGNIYTCRIDYGKDPWLDGGSGVCGQAPQALNNLLSLKYQGTSVNYATYTSSQITQGLPNLEIIPPSVMSSGQHFNYATLVNIFSQDYGWGIVGNGRNTWVTLTTVLIYDDQYCNPSIKGTDGISRDDNYCFTYGTSVNGRGWTCDEGRSSCVDPCGGCNSETGKCLASYAQDAAAIKQLLTSRTSLCVSNQYVCGSVSECGNYIKQKYGNSDPDQGDVIANKNDYDKFQYGVHCEKTNPSDPLIKAYNALSSSTYGDLGTCDPGAVSWRDCDNDETFGSATGYRFVDSTGNFNTAKGWGVNSEGQCVLIECAGAGTCPNNGQCIPKYLGSADTTYKSSLIGYCATPLINSECSVSADCASQCPANQNPMCTMAYSGGQYVGVCDCLDKPSPTLGCKTQTAYSGAEYCMRAKWSSLLTCKKYDCGGTAPEGSCMMVDAKCTQNSDCDVGNFKGYGTCVSGCCQYGIVPPPAPPVPDQKCGNNVCEGNERISCPSDCAGSPGWNDEIFSSLVGLLAAMLTFSLVYSYRKNPKNRAMIAVVIAGIVFCVVFFVVNSMNLQIADPFAGFIPATPGSCSTAGLVLGQIDPGYLGCTGGELMYYLGYLFAVGIGAFAAWMMYKTMSGNSEFADKPMVSISFAVIAFIVVFIIAKALFVFAIIIGILFIIFKYVMSPFTMVARAGGAIASRVRK